MNSFFSEKFNKDLKKLDPFVREQVKKELKAILLGTSEGNIKTLKNYSFAQYRLKIGSYRILFNYNEKTKKFLFLHCVHRGKLY